MADVRVTYDKTADAAYVYLTDPQAPAKAARMYPCDPVEVDTMINLDFDEQGRLIGIEVLAASSKLPKHLTAHVAAVCGPVERLERAQCAVTSSQATDLRRLSP